MHLDSLPFSIDTFHPRPTRTLPSNLFFLTHAHADHTQGLSASFTTGPIFCTSTTALVAHVRTKAPTTIFTPLPLNKRTKLTPNSPSSPPFHVTLIPTFHCPGACMFLFEGHFGTILHTGDFRATQSVINNLNPFRETIDTLVLDCTYCHPRFNFPSLRDATTDLIAFIQRERAKDITTDVLIGTDTFGKEELFMAIARRFQEKLVLERRRYDLLRRIDPGSVGKYFARGEGLPNGERCKDRGRIYVLHKWKVSQKGKRMWMARSGKSAVSVICSACEKTGKAAGEGDVTRVGYSSHSNFEELGRFVEMVRPRKIVPTVESCGYEREDGLVRDPAFWFQGAVREDRGKVKEGGTVERMVVGRCSARQVFARAAGVRPATGVWGDESGGLKRRGVDVTCVNGGKRMRVGE